MVIFNSYVKLPEGSEWSLTMESHSHGLTIAAKDQGATKYPAPRGQRPADSPRMQLHLEPQLWVKTEGRHGEMIGKSMDKSWEINGNHGHVMESRGTF